MRTLMYNDVLKPIWPKDHLETLDNIQEYYNHNKDNALTIILFNGEKIIGKIIETEGSNSIDDEIFYGDKPNCFGPSSNPVNNIVFLTEENETRIIFHYEIKEVFMVLH